MDTTSTSSPEPIPDEPRGGASVPALPEGSIDPSRAEWISLLPWIVIFCILGGAPILLARFDLPVGVDYARHAETLARHLEQSFVKRRVVTHTRQFITRVHQVAHVQQQAPASASRSPATFGSWPRARS